MREVVIVSAVRTAIGSFGGMFKDVSPVTLGETVMREALARGGTAPEDVDEVIMGNVLQAGLGQNVARQVALGAGLPEKVSAVTINHVCASGLSAVVMAARAIACGDADVVVAGGTENMSRAPHVLPGMRWGTRMGDAAAVDLMLKDGLTDAFSGDHMGITAENMARQWQIAREAQDAYALESQERAQTALKAERFKSEIVGVAVPQRKGDPLVMDTDEYPRAGLTLEKLAQLKPAFARDGSVTAGNASGINDGAAALVLMAKEKAQSLGVKSLGMVLSHASMGVDPDIMGFGPVPATRKALEKAGLTVGDLDLVEANEAFAVQSLVVQQELGLDPERTNVNGGAIALGHPIGGSGARILVTLLHEMQRRDARHGLATLCIGGGQGVALTIRRGNA